MKLPPVASATEWQVAREELLVKEKEATRARDALAAERRRLPMVQIEKEYAFEGPDGTASPLDLFEGRSQLILYHFMFGDTGNLSPWRRRRQSTALSARIERPNLVHAHAQRDQQAAVSHRSSIA